MEPEVPNVVLVPTDKRRGDKMNQLLDSLREIPELILQMILHPLVFFQSLRGTTSLKRAIVFSAVVGLIAVMVRFGIHLPTLPRPSVFAATLVIFPVMVILINLGTGYLCTVGWKAIGSREKYPVAHACVTYINLLIPVTIVLNATLVFAVALVINYVLAGFYYTVASIKTHSITPAKAVASVAVLSGVQLAFYFLVQAAKTQS